MFRDQRGRRNREHHTASRNEQALRCPLHALIVARFNAPFSESSRRGPATPTADYFARLLGSCTRPRGVVAAHMEAGVFQAQGNDLQSAGGSE